jgi:RNA methyltransferase, TrmH family
MASRRDDVRLLSTTSGRVRTARRLARRTVRARTGLFLAEGRQAVREALAEPGRVREVFATTATHTDLAEVARGQDVPWLLVDAPAMAALCDTVTPQGVVAVCHSIDVPLGGLVAAGPRLVAVCVDVRDPGNAGTVIRCADAAGADGVVLVGDSVDVHNAKAVRASVGSVFHLPVVVHRDVAEVVSAFRNIGVQVLAADGGAKLDLDDAIDAGLLDGPTAWLFGNEAQGLDAETCRAADHVVRIPVHGRAESLNLGTAAAVCLYASARAHRRGVRRDRPSGG